MISIREMNEAGFVGELPQDSIQSELIPKEKRELVSRDNRQTVGDISVETPRMTCRNVDVFYGEKQAIKNVSLDIGNHEVVAMIGPSGCGKTTTLRMIAGLEEITEGKIFIGDQLVNHLDPKDRNIAMVFQNYALYPHMTVFENIASPLRGAGMAPSEIAGRVEATDGRRRRRRPHHARPAPPR